MKRIKINFVDFHKGFDIYNNDFVKLLKKRYIVEISDNPQYLFYSCFSNSHLKYDCIRIFYTGECITPDFNECDYAIGFDRMSFGDRYIRIPLYFLFQYKTEFKQLENLKPFFLEDLNNKTEFCNFVYSNCFAEKERILFFEKLSQYKRVLSGGRYRNNVGGPIGNKKLFQTKCKFSIAFENTSYRGYVTEKLPEAFLARTIPIYYGDPNISEDFNEDAFINCHNFHSFDDVIERVKEIDNDDGLYLDIVNKKAVNPLHKEKTEDLLENFLFHIMDQEIGQAVRRPKSLVTIERQGIILRHRTYDEKIYPIFRKIKRGIIRAKEDAI